MPYWRLFYHIVWGTKQRVPNITPEVEALLFPDIVTKVTNLDGITYALNGTTDHIHLAVAIPPRLAVGDFVGAIKGRSSHLIRNKLDADFAWQTGYGAHTFAEKNLSAIRQYIERQKEHHANNTLKMALEIRHGDHDGPPTIIPD